LQEGLEIQPGTSDGCKEKGTSIGKTNSKGEISEGESARGRLEGTMSSTGPHRIGNGRNKRKKAREKRLSAKEGGSVDSSEDREKLVRSRSKEGVVGNLHRSKRLGPNPAKGKQIRGKLHPECDTRKKRRLKKRDSERGNCQ